MSRAQRKLGRISVGLVVLFVFASAVLAQVSANHDLSWHVIAGGGGRMESAGHSFLGTAGQPLTGPMSGSGHAVGSGFGSAGYEPGETPQIYKVYLPLVMNEQP
jgi:hypothetical protein